MPGLSARPVIMTACSVVSPDHRVDSSRFQYALCEVRINAALKGAIDDEFRFCFDDGTGLYFYRSRYYGYLRLYGYYNPTLHGFISEDPVGIDGGINLYAYEPVLSQIGLKR